MKKSVVLIIAAVLLGGLFTGCGSKAAEAEGSGSEAGAATDAGPAYVKDIEVDKSVVLGEYKGLAVSPAPLAAVSDADVDAFIEQVMTSNPMTEEVTGPAEEGHQVTFDYVGKLDGVAFEGGTGSYTLVIGSGAFIEDLEQGMIGMAVGEVKDVPATFPEDYSSAELAGKDVIFTVTMHTVESFPEMTGLNDEYVSWLTADEYTNVADFKAYVLENLELDAQTQYDSQVTNLLAEAVLAGCEFKELPPALVSRLETSLTNTFTYYAAQYNMDLNTYLAVNGMIGADADAAAAMKTQAEASARRYLAYQAIADAEDLNIADNEMEESLAEMATAAGATVEEYKNGIDIESYREYLMLEKVSDFVMENAVVTPVAADAAADPAEDAAADAASDTTGDAATDTSSDTAGDTADAPSDAAEE